LGENRVSAEEEWWPATTFCLSAIERVCPMWQT
jgi:hypothetical protein